MIFLSNIETRTSIQSAQQFHADTRKTDNGLTMAWTLNMILSCFWCLFTQVRITLNSHNNPFHNSQFIHSVFQFALCHFWVRPMVIWLDTSWFYEDIMTKCSTPSKCILVYILKRWQLLKICRRQAASFQIWKNKQTKNCRKKNRKRRHFLSMVTTMLASSTEFCLPSKNYSDL